MEIYTIGFTKTTAERFFGRLADAGIGRLLDVRLNNSSQLSGFAKAQDLPYFLDRLIGVEYRHEPLLAPTQAMLEDFKKHKGDWDVYEERFLKLMRQRRVEDRLDQNEFARPTALLCSEASPEHCHRKLVCDYLATRWSGVRAVHL